MADGRVVCGDRELELPEPAQDILAGEGYACALLESGRVACWGSATPGRVGRASDTAPLYRPHMVGVEGASDLVAGPSHACAIVEGSEVVCWGVPLAGVFGRVPRRAFLRPTRIEEAGE